MFTYGPKSIEDKTSCNKVFCQVSANWVSDEMLLTDACTHDGQRTSRGSHPMHGTG